MGEIRWEYSRVVRFGEESAAKQEIAPKDYRRFANAVLGEKHTWRDWVWQHDDDFGASEMIKWKNDKIKYWIDMNE